MPLGIDYATQDCSLARSLEMVGERWTLLVLRDCFFGVRRFSDFQHHLGISKAVLTDRLAGLVDDGLLVRTPCGGREEYTLTPTGLAVWPALFALSQWGEATASPRGPRRIFAHAQCGTDLETSGRCPACATVPGPQDLVVRPGPGAGPGRPDDPVSAALRSPRRLLTPVRGTTGR